MLVNGRLATIAGVSLSWIIIVSLANFSFGAGGSAGPKVKLVAFDEAPKRVVSLTLPPAKLGVGAQKTYSAKQIFTHSMTVKESSTTSREGKGTISAETMQAIVSMKASIELGIKKEIEKSTSTTYGTSEEHERTLTLVGDGKTTYRVMWILYYRTGSAKLTIDGEEVQIPFQIEENFDIVSEEVK